MENCDQSNSFLQEIKTDDSVQLLVEESKVLSDMNILTSSPNCSLHLAKFISKEDLASIQSILKTKDFTTLVNADIYYLLQLMKTGDYLDIPVICSGLKELIKNKLTIENCFEIFALTSDFYSLFELTRAALDILMTHVEMYYENNMLSDYSQDPYLSRYRHYDIRDIEKIIIYSSNYSAIAKIYFFQNWLLENETNGLKENILRILERINVDASYSPRWKIIQMRNIRDNLIQTNLCFN